MGGREGGWEDDGTVNSLGSGWSRFREWFVFALMVCERLLFGLSGWFGLAGLVWSGLRCTLDCRRRYYSFCFCLVVRSFRAVCCIQYSFRLVFARF